MTKERYSKQLWGGKKISSRLRKTANAIRARTDVVVTPSLSQDGGMARKAIQVHAFDLIEIRLGES